jgi:hypothetical protein
MVAPLRRGKARLEVGAAPKLADGSPFGPNKDREAQDSDGRAYDSTKAKGVKHAGMSSLERNVRMICGVIAIHARVVERTT